MKVSDCIHCKRQPRIVEIGGIFYVQCLCGKWKPYEFMGARKATAYAQWNAFNCPNNAEIIEKGLPPERTCSNYYSYYINGKEIPISEIKRYVDATSHYICTRFRRKNSIFTAVVIKGVKIERKPKRSKNVQTPHKPRKS